MALTFSFSFIIKEVPDYFIKDLLGIFEAIKNKDLKHAPKWYQENYPGRESGWNFIQYVEEEVGIFSIHYDLLPEGLWLYAVNEKTRPDILGQSIQDVLWYYKLSNCVRFTYSYVYIEDNFTQYGGGYEMMSAFIHYSEDCDSLMADREL